MKTGGVAATVAFAAAAMIAVSCSTTPPTIAETFWQVNLVRSPTQGDVQERLSLFVHVSDSEGISDLSSIYLLSDSSELYWRIDPSNWQSRDANGELWVGSNYLEMPDGSAIPRGKYRVLLSNLAGERATSDIFISTERVSLSHAPFPKLSIAGDVVRVTSRFARTTLWLYNDIGDVVGSQQGAETEVPMTALLPRGNRATFNGNLYAYAYDQSCGCGLIDGPYAVRYRR